MNAPPPTLLSFLANKMEKLGRHLIFKAVIKLPDLMLLWWDNDADRLTCATSALLQASNVGYLKINCYSEN